MFGCKKHKGKRRTGRKVSGSLTERGFLKKLGFLNLDMYFRSKGWKAVEAKLFKKHPICQFCKKAPSTAVHFNGWRVGSVLDVALNPLYAMCEDCYQVTHFDREGQTVRSHRKVSRTLEKLRQKDGLEFLARLRKERGYPPLERKPLPMPRWMQREQLEWETYC